jgi:hypothetical protein
VPINGFVSTFSSCTSGYRRITETAITMQWKRGEFYNSVSPPHSHPPPPPPPLPFPLFLPSSSLQGNFLSSPTMPKLAPSKNMHFSPFTSASLSTLCSDAF